MISTFSQLCKQGEGWALLDSSNLPFDFVSGDLKFREVQGEYWCDDLLPATIKRWEILKLIEEEGKIFYFKKIGEDADKKSLLFLTKNEYEVIIPILTYWNRQSKTHSNITIHKLPESIEDPVTKALKNVAIIIYSIFIQNFKDIPNLFEVFRDRDISFGLFELLITEYLKRQNSFTRGKLNFYSFVYNKAKNFSWLCKMLPPNNDLSSECLGKYISLFNRVDSSLSEEMKLKLKSSLRDLYVEYAYIKDTVGWFYTTIKPYFFNSWSHFCTIHIQFLMKEYRGNPTVEMIKPRNISHEFTKAYAKFIAYVKDTYEVDFYPTPEAFKIGLQYRYLSNWKKNPELFDTAYRYLHKSEAVALQRGKIKLICNMDT